MLRTILSAGVASACFMGVAVAADLPARSAPPGYVPPPVPVFTWTGFYVGANAGYAWTGNAVHTAGNDPVITNGQLITGTVPSSQSLHTSGVTAGGQIGYNYQFHAASFGGLVLGVEADGAYTDLEKSTTVTGVDNVPNVYHSHLDYLGTVRGRFGVAFDRVLVYATGGFAYGHASLAQAIYPNGLPAGFAPGAIWAGNGGKTQTGYAVGGGIEYAIPTTSFLNPFGAGAVTLRAEYLHYDLGTLSVALPAATYGPAGTSFTDRIRTSGDLVRGGINYKLDFSSPAAVVARY